LTYTLGRSLCGDETGSLVQRQEQHHPDARKTDGQPSLPDFRLPRPAGVGRRRRQDRRGNEEAASARTHQDGGGGVLVIVRHPQEGSQPTDRSFHPGGQAQEVHPVLGPGGGCVHLRTAYGAVKEQKQEDELHQEQLVVQLEQGLEGEVAKQAGVDVIKLFLLRHSKRLTMGFAEQII